MPNKKSNTQLVVVTRRNTAVQVPKKKKKAKTQRQSVSRLGPNRLSNGGGLFEQYVRALADPFNNYPPKLGWGCFVPTTVVTGYQRITIGLGVNTFATVLQLPCVSNGTFYGGTTASTNLLSSLATGSLQNQSAIDAISGEGRIIASGLRMTAAGPATSSFGFAYGTALTPGYWLQAGGDGMAAMTIGDVTATVSTEVFNPALGQVLVTGRPIDPDSYTFFAPCVDSQGWSTTTNQVLTMPFQVPCICWAGLAASTSMQAEFEIIQHYEVTPPSSHGDAGILGGNSADSGPVLSDYFPSFDQMYRAARSVLPTSVSQIRNSIIPGVAAGMAAPAAMLVGARRLLIRS